MMELDPKNIETGRLARRLRTVRQQAAYSPEACANALDMTAEAYLAAEEGRMDLSLPQLEALAMFLGVPVASFWRGDVADRSSPDNFSDYLLVRDRMIGVLLQQARLAVGLSGADLAGALGVDESEIEAYELGRAAIPLPTLAQLAGELGIALDTFIDAQHGPLAAHEAQWRAEGSIDGLPPHLQMLVADPAQMAYLEAAHRLSQMDGGQLRSLARLLLDISSDRGSA